MDSRTRTSAEEKSSSDNVATLSKDPEREGGSGANRRRNQVRSTFPFEEPIRFLLSPRVLWAEDLASLYDSFNMSFRSAGTRPPSVSHISRLFRYFSPQLDTSYATSFSSHAVIGTIAVATQMITGIAKPFIARLADLTSRPTALAISVALYTIGYIVVASSKTVSDVCGGQVLYTAGNAGIDFLMNLLIADITSLEWRGLATGLTSLPWIVNSFVAGYIYISTGISGSTCCHSYISAMVFLMFVGLNGTGR
ncbi:hypothetical protein C8J57DRAFT_1639160 [Mycena rebaudengoi]|nr:hypothetical protein C8J57DRAFT_1639160 [Mycena rebaudengoi]